MSAIHYKFRSALEYKTLTFEGLHISVADLKRLIYENEKINRSADFDLQITNAQTKICYEEDSTLVPRNASVVIARVPASKPQKLPKVWDRSTEGVVHRNRPGDAYHSYGSSSSTFFERVDLTKKSDLTEEEKLKEMERLSTRDYDPSNFVRKRGTISGQAPINYVCNRCNQTGHWINNCPMLNVRRTTGIPKDELMETTPDDPQAMLTSGGTYVVPILHKHAKLIGKKEKPPFFVNDEIVEIDRRSQQPVMMTSSPAPGPYFEDKRSIPSELVCKLCADLLRDAVLIKCCFLSFCDDCIRSRLLESDRHECPACHTLDIDPDSLLPNAQLRQAVNNFRNETGYAHMFRRIEERAKSSTPPTTVLPYAVIPPTRIVVPQPQALYQHQRQEEQPVYTGPGPGSTSGMHYQNLPGPSMMAPPTFYGHGQSASSGYPGQPMPGQSASSNMPSSQSQHEAALSQSSLVTTVLPPVYISAPKPTANRIPIPPYPFSAPNVEAASSVTVIPPTFSHSYSNPVTPQHQPLPPPQQIPQQPPPQQHPMSHQAPPQLPQGQPQQAPSMQPQVSAGSNLPPYGQSAYQPNLVQQTPPPPAMNPAAPPDHVISSTITPPGLQQYHQQPPPPGLSSVPSFTRPPPVLLPTLPGRRPLTEEEFYLEKERLLRKVAPRDAWEEFLERKDRRKRRKSSTSTSDESPSSGSSGSRSRSRDRQSSRRRPKYRRRSSKRRSTRSRSSEERRRDRHRREDSESAGRRGRPRRGSGARRSRSRSHRRTRTERSRSRSNHSYMASPHSRSRRFSPSGVSASKRRPSHQHQQSSFISPDHVPGRRLEPSSSHHGVSTKSRRPRSPQSFLGHVTPHLGPPPFALPHHHVIPPPPQPPLSSSSTPPPGSSANKMWRPRSLSQSPEPTRRPSRTTEPISPTIPTVINITAMTSSGSSFDLLHQHHHPQQHSTNQRRPMTSSPSPAPQSHQPLASNEKKSSKKINIELKTDKKSMAEKSNDKKSSGSDSASRKEKHKTKPSTPDHRLDENFPASPNIIFKPLEIGGSKLAQTVSLGTTSEKLDRSSKKVEKTKKSTEKLEKSGNKSKKSTEKSVEKSEKIEKTDKPEEIFEKKDEKLPNTDENLIELKDSVDFHVDLEENIEKEENLAKNKPKKVKKDKKKRKKKHKKDSKQESTNQKTGQEGQESSTNQKQASNPNTDLNTPNPDTKSPTQKNEHHHHHHGEGHKKKAKKEKRKHKEKEKSPKSPPKNVEETKINPNLNTKNESESKSAKNSSKIGDEKLHSSKKRSKEREKETNSSRKSEHKSSKK